VSDPAPNHRVVAALAGLPVRGRALVVGCGAGDDAEHVASLGYPTVAFDLAPAAIAEARQRFPHSTVRYLTADLLAPPDAWAGAFDLVVEAYTLQELAGVTRQLAMEQTARLVAPGGRLLVVAAAGALSRIELESLRAYGLAVDSIVDFVDRGQGRWRAWFSRPAAA